MKTWEQKTINYKGGYTLIELLVVISVMSLLSSIVLVSVNGAREKARYAKARLDILQISKAIEMARENKNLVLKDITGRDWSSGDFCAGSIQRIPPSHVCFVTMVDGFKKIGIPSVPIDPWGSPYVWDENEGENFDPPHVGGVCAYRDYISTAGPNGVNEFGEGDDLELTVPFYYCS